MNAQSIPSPRGPSRRSFLRSTAGLAMGLGVLSRPAGAFAAPSIADRSSESHAGRGRIYKAAKWQMIELQGSVREKFQSQRDVGFDGMELISPSDLDPVEVRRASDETGMPVHGVVDMRHWEIRLSSPDAAVREQGVAILEQALRDAAAFGGYSVLLVPGRVDGADENHDHVWRRSISEIRKALPLASRLGVRVLIENVWNGFCESPDQLRDYLDEIDSPWVGSYFDIGNAWKFAPSDEWIRTLGPRIVKLDCKGWSQTNGFCKIGDGDIDWPAVRRALDDVGFTGWCTAEVEGGDPDHMADIARRMNSVLQL
jgi:sugar phosphate isomerase/epimerase